MFSRTLALLHNDAMALRCVASSFEEGFRWLSVDSASALSLTHYSEGQPLLAHYREPFRWGSDAVLGRVRSRVILLSSTQAEVERSSQELPPFRYRNWSMTVGGTGDAVWKGTGETSLAIPAYLDKNRRGESLWEILFYQFLAFLHSSGGLAQDECDGKLVREALRAAVSQEAFWGGSPRDITVTVTDGHAIHAVAMDRPLYLKRLQGLDNCMACGGDVDGNPRAHPFLRAVALADTDELPSSDWETIGPHRVISVDRKLRIELFAL